MARLYAAAGRGGHFGRTVDAIDYLNEQTDQPVEWQVHDRPLDAVDHPGIAQPEARVENYWTHRRPSSLARAHTPRPATIP